MTKEEKFKRFIDYFSVHMPIAKTELLYSSPYELIVAVILSAQCTDKRVNMITPAFFKLFPDPKTLAKAQISDVYDAIKSCTYPNNKAKNLVGMANGLITLFHSEIPSDVEELQKLPGVGRKTANVIAAVVFNKPTLAVDTHVFRVAARIGLSVNAKTARETERQLMEFFPEELIPIAHHWLILHGRYVCVARNPKCSICGLVDICDYYSNMQSSVYRK